MSDAQRVDGWIESGKQVGLTSSLEVPGDVCWCSVGVQRWRGEILVHVSEALESLMAAEEHEREETLAFKTLAEARRFVAEQTRFSYSDLHPQKGQRIFNPSLRDHGG